MRTGRHLASRWGRSAATASPADTAPFAADPVIGLWIFCAELHGPMKRRNSRGNNHSRIFIVLDSNRAAGALLRHGSRATSRAPALMFEMPGEKNSNGAQTLLIDADDTLWENNIYFERAIAGFISFLNHQQLSPAEVREI